MRNVEPGVKQRMTWLTTVRQLGDAGQVIWSQTTDRPDVAAAAHSEMARGGPDAIPQTRFKQVKETRAMPLSGVEAKA